MGGYDSGRNPPRRIFKRNGHPTSLMQRFDIETIAAFKQVPSFLPDHFKTTRPVMENCCVCMPQRKIEWCMQDIKELGMRNILDCRSELSSKSGWLTRLFPLEFYAIRKPLFKPFPDISYHILSSPRVRKAIDDTATQIVQTSNTQHETKVLKSVEVESQRILKKMKASLSSVFIKIAAWLITKFVRNILGGIQVSSSQMAMLKKHAEKNIPVIYLPLHRSHMDYILVTLTLWYYDIRAPYVAAGENLDIPIINLLLRGLGGFFIRRRLDRKSGQKDILYRAILCQYMTEILKSNEGIEFFIEGGRTRTGRAIIPKGGLLSIIVEAFNKGEIPDAHIIPASFGYERIIDGDFYREQMGLSKIDESFFGAIKAILSILFGYYGSIRVDFAKPFSLREFIDYAKDNPNVSVEFPSDMESSMTDRRLSCPLLERSMSYPSHIISPQNGDSFNSRLLIKALADHTVYIADHCSSPMSTHLVAFLLLTKFRQGVKLGDLTKELQRTVKDLQALHVDVGFCGQSKDVVMYAQRLLGDKLVSKRRNADENVLELCPNLSIPYVFELSYYANFVSTHFALESIIACALLHEGNLSLFQLETPTPLPEMEVVRENVLDIAGQLCLLLHTEFIFVPPCTNLENALSDVLDSFVSKEIIKEDKNEDYGINDQERQMANRIARSLEIDEEEDSGSFASFQTFQVNVDRHEVKERLLFLVSVLGPVIESHFIVASFVLDKLDNEMTSKDFFDDLGDYARSRVENGLLLFAESCAILNLKSAVKSLQDLQMLYSYNSAGMVMVGLCDGVEAKEQLNNYVMLIKKALS